MWFGCLAPPLPPETFRVARETTSTVVLQWSHPLDDGGAPIDEFLIDLKGPHDSNFHTLCKVDGDLFTYNATKLEPGSTYEFQIKSKNEAGMSDTSTKLEKPATTKTKASDSLKSLGIEKLV